MRLVFIFFVATVLFSCTFAVDSLNVNLEMSVELDELRGVDTHDGYIYAFAKQPKLYSVEYVCGGGLFVVDSLVFDGFAMASHTHLSGRWIECESDCAFLADWSSGFHVIDITNPLSIELESTVTSAMLARSVYPHGDSLFVCSNSSGLHLYEIATGPTPLISFEPGSYAMDAVGNSTGTVWMAESGTGFSAWDLDDTSDPVSFVSFPGDAVRIARRDGLVFIAVWDTGIELIDVTDLESLIRVTTIDFWDDNVYDVEPWDGNRLLVAAGTDGFSVVNLGTGAAIWEDGYYVPDGANIIDVSNISNKAYAADENGTLYCFDLSDLAGIEESYRPSNISINAYPNPFNSSVRIAVDVPVGTYNNTPIQIEIYNIQGCLIDQIDILEENKALIWEPDNETESGIYLVKLSGLDIYEKITFIK